MYPWEAIAHMVKAQGVEFTFGIGDSPLQLYAESVPGIRPVNLRYEGSAPFMAMAYSRLTGKPGVCSASTGPGIANMVPGALEAYSGCSPLVMICPSISQKTEGMGEFQECDQLGMMRPVTKWSARVPHAERIPWFVRRAFSVAMNGQPGPVFLEIPSDVGGDITHGLDIQIDLPDYVPAKKLRCAGDPALIGEAADLILKAERRVAIAGNGTILSGASGEFKEFVELLAMPFLTTPAGRGIVSEEHPLALGLGGLYRNRVAKQVYSRADLVIAIGTRNEAFQTHRWRDFPRGAKLIQIDISPFEIGRNWVPDTAIVGDAGIVLRQLTDVLKERGVGAGHFESLPRIEELMKAKRELETELEAECMVEATPIPAKRIVFELGRTFGDNTILVNENGSQDTWSYVFPCYKLGRGSGCVPVAEQTCMGMGVVGAIAAKLTRPDKNVVCVVGDGAFQMYMKELPTAAQYNAGCTWVVLNNSAFGWPKYYQVETVGWNTTSFTVQPDFVRWAEACKCYGRRIEKPCDIRPALEEALKVNKQGTPAVLDFPTGLDMSHFKGAE